jgi:hypothetical protein
MRLLVSTLLILISISAAKAAEWGPCPATAPGLVSTCFMHDDGGTLYVACNTNKKLMSIALMEPRATWQQGAPMDVITRADDGSQYAPSHGVVVDQHGVIVEKDSTWDLSTMGKAKAFFIVSVGDYARVFPTANFRKLVDPVLAACGDHF